LAFTTIPGGDLADIILLGSEAADTVVLNTSQTIIANGFGGDDSITIANPTVATGGNTSSFTAPVTVFGGAGNDTFLLAGLTVGSSQILGGLGNDTFGVSTAATFDYQAAEANGNEGEDTFGSAAAGIRANGSQILGGANNDTIWVGASTNSEFNGNKNLDRINVIGNQTGGSVFGGKGIDFIDTAAGLLDRTYSGTSIDGADGNDVIFDTNSTVVADNSTLSVSGGLGSDNITLTLNNDGAPVLERALVNGGDGDDFITIGGTITGTRLSVNGGAGNDTIAAFGNINGGEGADAIDAGAATTFVYAMSSIATQTGLATTTIDSITGFATGTDAFKTGVAGTAANFTASGAAVVGYAAALNAANVFFTTAGNEAKQYYTIADTGIAAAGSGYIFFKNTTTAATATASLQINAVATVDVTDFIA